jgi:hypothetical protein
LAILLHEVNQLRAENGFSCHLVSQSPDQSDAIDPTCARLSSHPQDLLSWAPSHPAAKFVVFGDPIARVCVTSISLGVQFVFLK